MDGEPGGQGGDAVQPDGGGLYDLNDVPESLRSQIEPHFKKWDSNVTKKFQEHSQYRKQWEPYEQLGLNEYDPGQLGQLLEIFSDEEQFENWIAQQAEERGFGQYEDDGYDEEEGEEPLTMDQVNELLEERMSQALQPFHEQQQEAEQHQRLEEATGFIKSQLEELHGKHGDFPDEIICQLALAYDGEESIQQAYEDYQSLVADSEKGILGSKLGQPNAPEKGGRASTGAEPITDWKQATQMARERFRSMQ